MGNLAVRADRVDYRTHRSVVPCPTHVKVNPALLRRVGLTAIGQCLKEQYDAAMTPVPAHLSALVEQLQVDAHLRRASIITAVVYSLLLAGGLMAHAIGFPKFSTEPLAAPYVSISVPAPLASEALDCLDQLRPGAP
jgi:hypothetical protein